MKRLSLTIRINCLYSWDVVRLLLPPRLRWCGWPMSWLPPTWPCDGIAIYRRYLQWRSDAHGTWKYFNTLRSRLDGRHFADFSNTLYIIKMFEFSFIFSPKFVPKGIIDNKSALVQVMYWHQACIKPVAEPIEWWHSSPADTRRKNILMPQFSIFYVE